MLLDDQGMAPEWEGRRTLSGAFFINIDRIQPDPEQPRKILDLSTIDELADSVRAVGILQPIRVKYIEAEGMYQIISGERRYLAAKKAGLTEMPCWLQDPEMEDLLVHQVVENWQRVDLHPFDLADTLLQLRDVLGYKQSEIADLTGKPESEISRLLSLLKLKRSLQQQYRSDKSGRMSRRHLENIAKLPEEEQGAFHARVTEQNLTATQTEQLVQTTLDDRKVRPGRGAPKSTRRTIVTPKGTVAVTIRKKHPTTEDILEVLDLARRQINEEQA